MNTDNRAVAGHEFSDRDLSAQRLARIFHLEAQLAASEQSYREGLAAWKANRETLANAARHMLDVYDGKVTAPGAFTRAINAVRELVKLPQDAMSASIAAQIEGGGDGPEWQP